MSIHDEYLGRIINRKINGKFLHSIRIEGGHSGFVYIVYVEVDSKRYEYIVKLAKPIGSESLSSEKPEQRVYGGRSKSFEGAYNLLLNNQLPTFNLKHYGFPSDEIPYFFQVISKLEGYSIREHLVLNDYSRKEDLQKLAGLEFGILHLITRNYDGWVDQKVPYLTDWRDAFFLALNIRFYHLIENSYLSKQIANNLEIFIENKKNEWTNPKEYVFSHVDGLQGMVEYKNNKWVFNGHIDLEDYRFTDQRFVLAGFEIGANYSISNASDNFWKGYHEHKKVASSYDNLKNLFKLFYFMSWIQMINENANSSITSLTIIKNLVDKITQLKYT